MGFGRGDSSPKQGHEFFVSFVLLVAMHHRKTGRFRLAERGEGGGLEAGLAAFHLGGDAVLGELGEDLVDVALANEMGHGVHPQLAPVLREDGLTRAPASCGAATAAALRAAGFNDTAIHDATQAIGYFNYINRVADGLGVDLEPEMGR